MFETNLDRRNFLRGSALFAAAVGLTVVAPAAAQELDQQKPKDEKNSSGGDDKKSGGSSQKTYTDEDGRFVLRRVPPDVELRLVAHERDGGCGVSAPRIVHAGEVQDGLQLTLARP